MSKNIHTQETLIKLLNNILLNLDIQISFYKEYVKDFKMKDNDTKMFQKKINHLVKQNKYGLKMPLYNTTNVG